MNRVLLIELKKGASKIARDEVNQACGYVEDLLTTGALDGAPSIKAFVVGHSVDEHVQFRASGERGHVEAVTYDRLVRTANMRLFRLRQTVTERYEGVSTGEIVGKLDSQRQLFGG